jgi:hypothetical protein
MRNLAALLIAVLASQAYRAAPQSPEPAPATVGAFVHGLAPGTHVSLKLTNGTKVQGILIAVDADAVSVKPKTRIPEPVRRVRLADIDDADLRERSLSGKTVALGAAVGAGQRSASRHPHAAVWGRLTWGRVTSHPRPSSGQVSQVGCQLSKTPARWAC